MLVTQYSSINVCFKLYAEESYSLADSKEGSGGPGVRGSGGPGVRESRDPDSPTTFSFLPPPVP